MKMGNTEASSFVKIYSFNRELAEAYVRHDSVIRNFVRDGLMSIVFSLNTNSDFLCILSKRGLNYVRIVFWVSGLTGGVRFKIFGLN